MISKFAIKLAADGEETPLPTEFRLFVSGWNDTENGRYLFDAEAAQSVMAAYAAWGVDLAIDLEHQMLDVAPGASPDPTARDARGSCGLELRGGDLWACKVVWTPDGAARLRERRQRYVSPAFDADPKSKRVLKMVNVAITSIPATHKTPALCSAKSFRRSIMDIQKVRASIKLAASMGMDAEIVKKALEAVEAGDTETAMELLKGMIVSAASGDEAPSDDSGSADGGAEGVADPEKEAVIDPKVVAASAEEADEEDEDKPEKKVERKAMRAMLRRLTGVPSLAGCVAKVEEYRAAYLTLETERQKLSKERATLEAAERRKLVTELVTLGAEFPATVWADDKASAVQSKWLRMPMDDLRSHVSLQRKARSKGGVLPVGLLPAANAGNASTGDAEVDAEVAKLSAFELKICKDSNCEPSEFVRLRRYRDGKGAR